MARNMKMELLTSSLILFESKNCGHRIHVLFMMYDVYWYCQMKKKRTIMKILKKEWFIWKFLKRGVVEKRGRRKRNPCPMRLWYIVVNIWQRCWWELTLIKLRFSSAGKGNRSRLWLSCLDSFVLLLPKLWKLFGFAIFQFVCVPDEVYSRNTPCALKLI